MGVEPTLYDWAWSVSVWLRGGGLREMYLDDCGLEFFIEGSGMERMGWVGVE